VYIYHLFVYIERIRGILLLINKKSFLYFFPPVYFLYFLSRFIQVMHFFLSCHLSSVICHFLNLLSCTVKELFSPSLIRDSLCIAAGALIPKKAFVFLSSEVFYEHGILLIKRLTVARTTLYIYGVHTNAPSHTVVTL